MIITILSNHDRMVIPFHHSFYLNWKRKKWIEKISWMENRCIETNLVVRKLPDGFALAHFTISCWINALVPRDEPTVYSLWCKKSQRKCGSCIMKIDTWTATSKITITNREAGELSHTLNRHCGPTTMKRFFFRFPHCCAAYNDGNVASWVWNDDTKMKR